MGNNMHPPKDLLGPRPLIPNDHEEDEREPTKFVVIESTSNNSGNNVKMTIPVLSDKSTTSENEMEVEESNGPEEPRDKQRLQEFSKKIKIVASFPKEDYDENLTRIFVGEEFENSMNDISESDYELRLISQLLDKIKDADFESQFEAILPYAFDLIKRRMSFDQLLQEMAVSEIDFFKDLDAQDLLALLIERFSPKTQSKIGYLLVKANYPIPFAYKVGPSPDDWRINFNLCYEMMLETDNILVTMIGTGRQCGITSLCSRLFSLKEDSLISSSEGFTHKGSLGVYMSTKLKQKKIVLADIHSYLEDPLFVKVCKMLFNFSALVVVHVTRDDFDAAGNQKKNLAELLQSLEKDVVLEKRGNVLVLWRDFKKEHGLVQKLNDYMKNTFGIRYVGVKTVNNLQVASLNRKEYNTEINSIRQYFVNLLGSQYSAQDYYLHSLSHLEAFFKEDCDELSSVGDPIARKYNDPQNQLIKRYYDLLDSAAMNNPNLLSTLFPYLYSKYVKWETIQELEALKMQMDREPDNFKALEEKKCKMERILETIEKEDVHRSRTGFVRELLTILQRPNQALNIKAFQNAIFLWKMPKVQPKQDEWSDLAHALLQMSSELAGDKKESLQNKIKALEQELENLDISLDSGISEIMSEYEAKRRLGQDCKAVETPLKSYFKVVMDSGSPINLIDGKTLLYGNAFLEELFQGIPWNENEKYFVISIIGAQSSAKSTLFNFLFACGFETSAGRCTKGLYLTLVKLPENMNIIVIDTEGLLSVCARNNLFDNKIVAMTFTIAHIVIVNNKGELTTTLQELMEVCLYALKAMNKKRFKTQLLFAIRDHSDGNNGTQRAMLQQLLQGIDNASKELSINFREFLEIGDNDIYLLPSAIDKPEEFSTKTFQLRRDIFAQLKNAPNPYHSMHDFYSFGQSVWSAIEKCGDNLLNYKSMLEIQIQDNLNKLRIQTVSQYRQELTEAGQELTQNLLRQRKVQENEFYDQINLIFRTIVQKAKTQFGNEADKSRQYGENQQWKEKNRELIEGDLAFTKGCLCKDWEFDCNAKLKDDEQAEVLKDINKEFSKVLREGAYSKEDYTTFLKTKMNKLMDTYQRKLLDARPREFDLARKVQNVYCELKEKKSIQNPAYKTFPEIHCDDIWKLKGGRLKSYKLERYTSGLGIFNKGKNFFKNKDRAQSALNKCIDDFYSMLEHMMNNQAKDFVEQTIEQCFVFFERMIINLQIRLDYYVLAEDFFAEGLSFVYEIITQREEQSRVKKMQDLRKTTQKEFDDFEKLLCASKNSYNSGAEMGHQVFEMVLQNFAKNKFNEIKRNLIQKINSCLPGPEKANELAYAESFGSRNLRNVYKYVRDINKFIKELYDSNTAGFSKTLINKHLENSDAAFLQLINKLKLLMEQWEASLEDMEKQRDSATIWKSLTSIVSDNPELKVYLNLDLLASKPVNFEKYTEFAEGFRKGIFDKYEKSNLNLQLSEKLETDIENFLKERWNDICGCQAVCPLCGNKCKLPNDKHTQHQASFHFFPSFKGILVKDSNKLVLTHCLSKESLTYNWFWKGTTYANFDGVIAADQPDWRDEFPRVDQIEKFKNDIPTNVKLCWVGVKELLKLKYPQMADTTPQEWLCMMEKKDMLTEIDEDLQKYN